MVLWVAIMAPLERTTSTSTHSLDWSQRPSALAQVVVVAVEHRAQRLVAQARQVDAVQVVVVVAGRRQALAVLAARAVTAFYWSMKCTRYEQSVCHKGRHRA